MRILHVAESVKGGCGTYLNQLVRNQLADDAIEEVRVIVPRAHAGQVPDIPASHRALFPGPERSLPSLYALWRATSREVDAFSPDCIHLHSTFAGAVGRLGLALRMTRPPVIYCPHGWAFDMAGSPVRRAAMTMAERTLSPGCDLIVAISEYERQRGIAAGIAPGRIVTVLNGMADASPPPPPRPGPRRRVLFVGRLDRQKGVDILLEALAGAADQVDLRIIGSAVVGDEAPVTQDIPGMTLLGWCDEARIRQELAWAQCVVVPSRWEGFGLVAVEAMRAGRAVIAASVGGLPEVVEHGVTGWLVPPDDAKALRKAILAPNHSQLMVAGAAGRQRFLRRFTVERMAAQLSEAYRQAIGVRMHRRNARPMADAQAS